MQATAVVEVASGNGSRSNGGSVHKGKGQASWFYSGWREVLNVIGLDSSPSSVATF